MIASDIIVKGNVAVIKIKGNVILDIILKRQSFTLL